MVQHRVVGRLVPAAVLGLALMLAFASAARATMRATSTLKEGLVISDKNATFSDEVRLRLVSTGTGLKYEVFKTALCGGVCVDAVRWEPGSGCGTGQNPNFAICERRGSKITINFAGGDDSLNYLEESLPITDAMTVNAGTGDDRISASLGNDTINGGAGNDSINAHEGDDVINGGPGNDRLTGEAGDDALSGDDGDDQISLGVGSDTAEGGAGSDSFGLATSVRDGRDTVNGGIGGDSATYSTDFASGLVAGGLSSARRLTEMRIIEANLETIAGDKDVPENDVLRSIESYEGGADEDIITGAVSSNPSSYLGGGDDDTIFGSSADNTLEGGPGSDQLDGNAGDDVLDAKAGEGDTAQPDPVIDCGAGTNDLAVLDLKDDSTPSGCDDNIDRSPAGEDNVNIKRSQRIKPKHGRAAFRLTCPKSGKRTCNGRLRLTKGRKLGKRAKYSIKAGNSRRVRVRVGSLGAGTAKLVATENGIKGRHITTRRVVLRRL